LLQPPLPSHTRRATVHGICREFSRVSAPSSRHNRLDRSTPPQGAVVAREPAVANSQYGPSSPVPLGQAEAAISANCRGTVGPTLVTRGGSNGFQELFVTSRGNWKTNRSRHGSRLDGGDVAGSESRRGYLKRHRRQRTAGDLECRGRIAANFVGIEQAGEPVAGRPARFRLSQPAIRPVVGSSSAPRFHKEPEQSIGCADAAAG
jgi:hypothetical protein